MEYNSMGSRKKSRLSSHEGTAHKDTCKQKYKIAVLARGQENNKKYFRGESSWRCSAANQSEDERHDKY